jgi:hypothetical protein
MFGILQYVKTVINNIIYNNLDRDYIILEIQNVSLLCICLTTLYTSFQYYPYITGELNANLIIENGPKLYDKMFKIILINAVIDLFFIKKIDLILHHFLILGFTFYGYYYNINLDSIYYIIYYIVNTEISSIFNIFRYWIPKNTNIYIINGLIFYTSFFKYRIFDYYVNIISKDYLKLIIDKYSSSNYILSGILVSSTYGLFILNLYWFSILTKILFKMIRNNIINPLFGYKINKDMIVQYLCSYVHYINIPLAIYLYHHKFIDNSNNHKIKYLIDITGIVCLSISSYNYHYDIYKRLVSKEIDSYILPSKKNIIYFFIDCIFIQLRPFLTLLTSYYNTDIFMLIIFIPGLFHIFSLYNIILNILKFLFVIEKEDFNLQKYHIKIHYIITVIPIIIDIILIYINSSHDVGTPFLFINIAIFIIYVVEPFYDFTHFIFHLLLIVQTYYLCLSHSDL